MKQKSIRTIALVGNPNSGKSSIFNLLTGLRQRVGNFPGVTVDRKSGFLNLGSEKVRLLDLPGSYSLDPATEDEKITSSVLLDSANIDYPDAVVVVADATHLKRSLLLCTEVMDLGLPVLLAVNMIDLVGEKQASDLCLRTSVALGIPVVGISALKKSGILELKSALAILSAKSGPSFFRIPGAFLDSIRKFRDGHKLPTDYAAWRVMLCAEKLSFADPASALAALQEAGIGNPGEFSGAEIAVRYDKINSLLDGLPAQVIRQKKLSNNLDRIFLNKWGGYLIFIAMMLLVFQAIFAWAEYPMNWIEAGFSALGGGIRTILPAGFAADLIVDGILAGLSGIVVFIPQIALLFMFIAILEDSGYMSRVVFLMDRLMKPFGFSGKSVIPLIGGMACAVPSIMAARNIPDRKERLITIMVTPLMSCSARIPVYTLLIGMFVPSRLWLGVFNLQGIAMMGFYLAGFAMALVVALVLRMLIRKKSESVFVTELPMYRMPRWGNVGISMWSKSRTFVWEAGRVIMVVSVVLWLLASFAPGDRFAEIKNEYSEILEHEHPDETRQAELEMMENSDRLKASYAGEIGSWIEPVIAPLGFDWKIGIALVTSFAAREVFVGTMATIYSVGQEESDFGALRSRMLQEVNGDTGKAIYSPATAIALMVFYAFAMQCMSTLAVTRKETRSWMWTIVMLVYMTGLAWIAAFVVQVVMG